MLKLIYGVPGSGKTYITDTMILKRLRDGEKVTLLVPEQEVMEAERRIADRAEREGVFCEKLTVVSFRRLANLAFRTYGGIEYKTLGDGGRLIVIWRIVEELTPALRAYQKSRGRALCEMLLAVCNELKRNRITPISLSKAADEAGETPLGDKLNDIALIYSAYLAELSEDYSDTSDDVERLAEILAKNKFLTDTTLFLDSFNGFTANELRAIEYAMLSCDVYITLCRPETSGRIGFKTVEMTERQLISAATKHNITVDTPIRLSGDTNFISENLRLIEKKLWALGYSSPKGVKNDSLSLIKCRDRFFEAEYIAVQISKLVREGARYRDIAIIGRNTESYEGVLDVVLEKYGIPLFYSHRSKLTSSAFYRTVSGALSVIAGGFKTDDILSYIKCGCVGLSDAEINLIETYASRWGRSTISWTDEYRWSMNPDGFSDRDSDEIAVVLDKINELREQIRDPLIKLRDSLRGNCNVSSACKAIYTFMLECGCYERAKTGARAEDITVFNTMISLLETLNEVGGDIPVNAKFISELLYMAAKNTDYGRIPQSFDCVLAGDASILRASGRSHIFLTACENGIFPRSVADDSFFSDSDRDFLTEKGISLTSNTSARNDDEMFYFLRAALSASKTLTLTVTPNEGKYYPSPGFTRMQKLFPENKVFLYPDDFSAEDRIQTLSSAQDIVCPDENDPLYSALYRIYAENGIFIPPHRLPLFEKKNRVSSEITEMQFGKVLNMTQYRFEDYAKCPFSYYSKYILKLTEQKRDAFRASDIGTFIHRILEKVISYIFPPGKERIILSDDDLCELIKRETDKILSASLGESFVKNGRITALIKRLTSTVTFLIKNLLSEFEHSSFAPRFFEMPIGGENSSVKPLSVKTDDGSTIYVYGYVDRVDTFVKDGQAYIRVVDYKTGSSEHSLKRISLGLEMQMYLYLFALCKSDNKELRRAIGVSDDAPILPAGVMYHHSHLKTESCKSPITLDDALNKAEKKLVRTGVLLNNEAILRAMEDGLEGRFIPVTIKKDKLSATKSELKTLDEFGYILEEITDVMKNIGNKIKSGCADASPLKSVNPSPCKYCKLKPFCRNTK